jgi:hypothetical protein
MPEEEIEECVNGYYEAGFALMVATKDRMLLVDKKPMGYLTIEDMRFDMINELDLHHRLMGAQIKVSAGNKTLHFTSLNQVRLRRLLTYVQARMTQIKRDKVEKEDEQKRHLEEMNEQLRLYLMAAHKQQYIDQAQSIRTGEPVTQQAAPAQAIGSVQLPTVPQKFVNEAPQIPNSPFEQAAAAAFDSAQTTATAPVEQPAAAQLQPEMQMSDPGHVTTPQQIGLAAARRVVPIISAYTKLPMLKRSGETPKPQPVNPEPA